MQSQVLCSLCGSGLLASVVSFNCRNFKRRSYFDRKLFNSRVRRHGFRVRRRVIRVCAGDDDSEGVSSFSDLVDSSRQAMFLSSDGETSDVEAVSQVDDDSPASEEDQMLQSDDSTRTIYGVLNNLGIMSFSTFLLLLVDHYAWQIARLPLPPFYLIHPFLISIILVSCAGYICTPLFRTWKLQSMVKKEVPAHHSYMRGTPTMGGLYLVPIGILVAESALGFSSVEVSAAAAAAIAFAVIGLLDDFLTIKNKKYGLVGWISVFLKVSFGMWFSYWFYTKNLSTPYRMKMGELVSYPLLTTLLFFSMPNGVNLTDGLDGLAAGTAALAFIGMSIVVLPICCDLSVFGASMAGACIGFLFQNQHKASISMGGTGALALGGALAAMASCTGTFLPLLIASGVFVLEAFSVALQAAMKYLGGKGYRSTRTAPLHHHLELYGIKEPVIVAAAYVAAGFLSLWAAYVGLTSAHMLR